MKTPFTIDNDAGLALVGDVWTAPKSLSCVFIQHGLSGHRKRPFIETLIQHYVGREMTVCAFDATCSLGESAGELGEATLSKHAADLESVIAWAQKQSWYQEPFLLVGHSLGAASAVLFAQKHPRLVSRLILFSLVTHFDNWVYAFEKYRASDWATWTKTGKLEKTDKITGRNGHFGNEFLEDLKHFDTIKAASSLETPASLFMAEKDVTTPPECQRPFFEKLASPIKTISSCYECAKATHSFETNQEKADLLELLIQDEK